MDGQIEGTKLEATSESRVRINLKQSAKGDVQFDITAEFPTAAESAEALGKAIDETRILVAGRGLKLADSAA